MTYADKEIKMFLNVTLLKLRISFSFENGIRLSNATARNGKSHPPAKEQTSKRNYKPNRKKKGETS